VTLLSAGLLGAKRGRVWVGSPLGRGTHPPAVPRAAPGCLRRHRARRPAWRRRGAPPHHRGAGRQRLAPAGHRRLPRHQPQGAVGEDAQVPDRRQRSGAGL